MILRKTVIADETKPDDYTVWEGEQSIGRIRLAVERTPPIWIYNITVPRAIPPYGSGSADRFEDAKAEFKAAWETFSAERKL